MEYKSKNELLYEKCHNYRLHADKLRWTLLAGFVAFFAVITPAISGNGPLKIPKAYESEVFFALALISIFYLLILAVQSWYYNVFAEYATHCDDELVGDGKLVSLKEFRTNILDKSSISPMHPSFSFAILLVWSVTYALVLAGLHGRQDCFSILVNENVFLSWLVSLVFVVLIFKYFWNIIYRFLIAPIDSGSARYVEDDGGN